MIIKESMSVNTLTGKNILLTGATGFVGKVLLEKLVRVLPGRGKIYVLIRPNQHHTKADDRLYNDVLASSIFDPLKKIFSDEFDSLIRKRLRVVAGEFTDYRFGLDTGAFLRIASRVDVIINCAASVNFREPLDQALEINTLALDNLAMLSDHANDCPLVHVSTCYVHGYHQGLCGEENVFPKHAPDSNLLPRSPQGYFETEPLMSFLENSIQQVIETHPEKERETTLVDLGIEQAKRFGWNDTYTFTKWLGEQRLMKAFLGKRLTILRPSIVESALSDPAPGWIEGIKVTDVLILAYAREKVSFFPGNSRATLDIIPVDLVVNSIVMSTAEALGQEKKLRIYQCSSSRENPVKISFLINTVRAAAEKHHEKYNRLFFKKPRKPFVMTPVWLFERLTATSYFLAKKRYEIKRYFGLKASHRSLLNLKTTLKLALIFSFYSSPCFTFQNDQLLALSNRMGEADKTIFPVSASRIDWHKYLSDIHLNGLNKYALKAKT